MDAKDPNQSHREPIARHNESEPIFMHQIHKETRRQLSRPLPTSAQEPGTAAATNQLSHPGRDRNWPGLGQTYGRVTGPERITDAYGHGNVSQRTHEV